MPMRQNGLAKLVEECGEVQQVAGKMLQYPELQGTTFETHPDGTHLKSRLEDEIADVFAACDFVCAKLELNKAKIVDRAKQKQALFMKWDKEA